jgi:hypothetical protein
MPHRGETTDGSAISSGHGPRPLDPAVSEERVLLLVGDGHLSVHRSTIVTTNLSFKQWGTVFPGAACVVALVDRFAQHCHVVDLDADAWRQKHALARESREGESDPVVRRRRASA